MLCAKNIYTEMRSYMEISFLAIAAFLSLILIFIGKDGKNR